MSKVQRSVEKFQSGKNCSQSIFSTYGPDYGLSQADCMRISSGFGGGMRKAEVCGAVTGAIMTLGLQLDLEDHTDASKESVNDKVLEFESKFEHQCGSLICRELVGFDISTDQGRQEASSKGAFTSVCPELVRVSAEILEEII